jgi:hypothetical protein
MFYLWQGGGVIVIPRTAKTVGFLFLLLFHVLYLLIRNRKRMEKEDNRNVKLIRHVIESFYLFSVKRSYFLIPCDVA